MKERKHYIIPIFIPHDGCPEHCIFCNQNMITGQRKERITARQVETVLAEHFARLQQVKRSYLVEAAFYGGSFTALSLERQQELLLPASKALQEGRLQRIRVSTRPDCLDEAIIANLQAYGVDTVELGLQSLDDQVLKLAGRNHKQAHARQAAADLQAAGMNLGIQLMPGLPGEDWLSLLATNRAAALLRPDFVRIYPTIVLAKTVLASWYQTGRYQPLSLTAAVRRSAYMKLYFERCGSKVIRTGLQPTVDLQQPGQILAGPFHPAFGELVEAELFYLMVAHCLEQVENSKKERALTIHYSAQDASKLRGNASSNLQRLRQKFSLTELKLLPDGAQPEQLELEWQGCYYIMNKKMLCCL